MVSPGVDRPRKVTVTARRHIATVRSSIGPGVSPRGIRSDGQFECPILIVPKKREHDNSLDAMLWFTKKLRITAHFTKKLGMTAHLDHGESCTEARATLDYDCEHNHKLQFHGDK